MIKGSAADNHPIPLPGGAWLLPQKQFSDKRGHSFEAYNAEAMTKLPIDFHLAQENIIFTSELGTLRGMHYQLAPHAQAKITTTLVGLGQYFWLTVNGEKLHQNQVHSIILGPGDGVLVTRENHAHGFLALQADTAFSMKLSRPIQHRMRRQISFQADLPFNFKIMPRFDLLSERDQAAPAPV